MSDDSDKTNPLIVLDEVQASGQPLTRASSPRGVRTASAKRAAAVTEPLADVAAALESLTGAGSSNTVALLSVSAPRAPREPPTGTPSAEPPSSLHVDYGTLSGAPVNPDYLSAGLNIRGWVVETKIGQGGMGAVYLVRDASEQPPLRAALKMSMTRAAAESDSERTARIRRFEREAGVILTLEHSNIIKPLSFFTWQGHPCLVMPYVEGDQLKTYCRKVKPTLRQILETLFRPVADALDYLHHKDIFHRDIKPANIMVRRADGVPLLMDFGIARSRAAATLTSNEVLATLEFGCPEYLSFDVTMTPEFTDGFVYTSQADLFCLGATFFELLTGQLPYHHIVSSEAAYATPAFKYALMRYEPLRPSSLNPALPAELDPLFVSLIARSPADRPPDGGAVMDAIDAYLAAHPAPDALLDTPFVPPDRKRHSLGSDEPTPRRRGNTRPPPPPPPTQDGAQAPEAAPAELAMDALSVSLRNSSAAAAGFKPPTVVAKPQGFQPPVAADPSMAPQPQEPGLNTQLRKASAFLEGSGAQKSASRRTGLYVGGGLLLVVALILGVAATSASSGAPTPSQPTSLLDAPSAAPVEHSPPPGPALVPIAAAEAPDAPVEGSAAGAEVAPAPPVVTPPSAQRTSVRKGATADQQAVEALLEQEYGGQRPKVGSAGGTGASKPAEPSRPAWLRVSNAVPQVEAPNGTKSYGVPLGTEMTVRLTKPLDSRTISAGPVVVKLMRPLVVRGAAVFPSGSMAYGVASVGGGSRFDVRFSRLKLPDGVEVPFDGIAYDADDKKPGLRPSSRVQGTGGRGPSLGETVLKGTANTLLGKAAGNDAVDIARGAGQTILGHDGANSGGGTQDALLLDAPADFVVFVAQAF